VYIGAERAEQKQKQHRGAHPLQRLEADQATERESGRCGYNADDRVRVAGPGQ